MRQRLSALSGLELRYAISDSWIPDHCFLIENDFRRRFNKDMIKFSEHPMLLGKKRRIFPNTWTSTSEEEISISDDDRLRPRKESARVCCLLPLPPPPVTYSLSPASLSAPMPALVRRKGPRSRFRPDGHQG